MRWAALFADLRAQSAAQQQEEFEVEVAEAIGLAWSRTPLVDRIRAHAGQEIRLRLTPGAVITIQVEEVGSDWLSGSEGAQSWLIPLAAVLSLSGLERRAQPETSPSQKRLGIGAPLRALAAAREPIVVHTAAGELIMGQLMGVGADFVDIRGAAQPGEVRTLPMHALSAVRSAGA